MRKARAMGERRDRIIAAALAEADRVGWPALRLHRVAGQLGISLAEIYREFRDADAIAEDWLARADRAMLRSRGRAFARRPQLERLSSAILAWLDALAPYRRVTAQMLLGKLYPGHPHHLVGLVTRLSRTVQWWREAALLDAGPPRRQVEEVALTWLFVATVAVWANDRTPDATTTRRFLERALGAIAACDGLTRQIASAACGPARPRR